MEIFDSILGNASDSEWKRRLEGAQVDWLELSQWDAQKNRFRKKTAGGRSMAVALERGHALRDGDILDWDEAPPVPSTICFSRLCPFRHTMTELVPVLKSLPEPPLRPLTDRSMSPARIFA